jgi:DNA-binding IclR family transcriptional regulator
MMGILDGGQLVYIDKRESDSPLKLTSEIGKRNPPYFGMLGKTLMAFLSEEEVENLLRRFPLQKLASRSITDPKRFKESLREIREKGYILQESEAMEGVTGIAAPIRNHLGQVVAAAGTVFPSFDSNRQKINKIIHWVLEAAEAISLGLGYNARPSQKRSKADIFPASVTRTRGRTIRKEWLR